MTEHALLHQVASLEPASRVGFVRKLAHGHVEATGPFSTIGDICEIECRRGVADEAAPSVLAEVIAVEDAHIVLAPLSSTASIFPSARVVARPVRSAAPVGDAFAGRAVGAFGEPIDGKPPILSDDVARLEGDVMPPMDRQEPSAILETGLRALDGVLPIGRGQRIGIFAASGVGKTTLMRQLAGQVACDHCVLCLVGERGREVESIWRELTAQNDRARYSCVAATSDLSAAIRVRAVYQALCLAEHWRAKGKHVLLIVDSVTRFAMALRELGLAAGAPPTLRAYTPNVFSALPRLVERCGASKKGGSITAVITVLSETDEVDDPIVEVMKSLLDGHIVLSRQLAEQGHFPAIDVTRSVSRQAERLMAAPHRTAAQRAISLLSAYEDARLMIDSGIYKAGANTLVDEAIRSRDGLRSFLQQRSTECSGLSDTLRLLQPALTGGRVHA